MAKRLTKNQKLVEQRLVDRYGKGKAGGAWGHMSLEMRGDARLAAAAHILLMQDITLSKFHAAQILIEDAKEE